MSSRADFERQDRIGAENFGEAAKVAGVRRIIYLGGLGESGTGLSRHLRSRHEMGELLRKSGVPVTEFRTSIILGSWAWLTGMGHSLCMRGSSGPCCKESPAG
ncbi:MAG: hypothetical protein ABIG68_13015 [Acidobacteriota bacterium]